MVVSGVTNGERGMIREKFDLTGKTAVVTGSTRGIGKAIGDAFEEYGAKVIRHDSKVCNLANPEAVEAWFKTLPPVDIMVCNASIQSNEKWYEVSRETMLAQMQVNFNATFRLFQLCYPHMKERGWGRLIAVGSAQERRPHPEMPVYSASKAAQENLVRSVARQVAKEGITVNNLCPGVFFTDRNKDALGDPVYGPKVKAAIPLNDYAMPEDAAGAALLLASDAGRYITGATIMVDGGLSLPG